VVRSDELGGGQHLRVHRDRRADACLSRLDRDAEFGVKSDQLESIVVTVLRRRRAAVALFDVVVVPFGHSGAVPVARNRPDTGINIPRDPVIPRVARDRLGIRIVDDQHQRRRVVRDVRDRQLAAVSTALQLGYYEVPREGTLSDVADELGCAESTASVLLRRAERDVLSHIFGRYGGTSRAEQTVTSGT